MATKPKLSDKDKEDYTKTTNYIQSLYIQQGIDKKAIPWGIITAQIKQILTEDKTLNYAQLLYVLNYMVDILGMNLFSEEYNGSILNLVPYYINEAREFCIKCKDIRKMANEFDFDDKIKVVKIGNRDKKIEQMEFD